jgi:hypothetical protein
VDKASAVHRLNDRDHIAIAQSMHKPREPVEIGRHRARVDERSVDTAGAPVETLAAETKSAAHTHLSDPLGSRPRHLRSPGEALPHRIRKLGCAVKSACWMGFHA